MEEDDMIRYQRDQDDEPMLSNEDNGGSGAQLDEYGQPLSSPKNQGPSGKELSFAEQKAALKRKIMAQPSKKQKVKKQKKDTVYNPDIHNNETEEEIQDRVQRKKKGQLFLNDFHILSTLGTGTFGRVRLVKHRSDDANVDPLALKCLKKSAIIKLKQIDHVKSEKRVLALIDHPFIVNLKGYFQTPSHIYMLLDYACGGELFTLLRKEGRFANDVALFFASEILLAFDYLHGMDIAYRDLKPENLLIDREGHVKITDFGFAKEVKDKTYTLCGTPEYLAPEIIQSKGHNKNVDWWALGVLVFEMLAGYPPFYDDNPMGIYQKIMDGYYEFPPHVEPKARDLVKSFLCADRSLRLGYPRNGAEEVKAHKWFRGVDWRLVMSRGVSPPWVPKIRNLVDTQYFDRYAESQESHTMPNDDQQRHFVDF